MIVLNEIKEWEFQFVLFSSTESSWARIADGKSLYHLGLIYGVTVISKAHKQGFVWLCTLRGCWIAKGLSWNCIYNPLVVNILEPD